MSLSQVNICLKLPNFFKDTQTYPLLTFLIGANSPLGIGRASAHQFAQNGAKALFLCDINNSYLEAHKREINSLYRQVKVHVLQFDASNEDAVKSVVDDAIKIYGRLDIFFANAGIVGQVKHFTQISSDEFLNTLKINLLRQESSNLTLKYIKILSKPLVLILLPNMEHLR